METDSACKRCVICSRDSGSGQLVRGDLIRDTVLAVIRQDIPGFSDADFVCVNDLNRYLVRYAQLQIQEERGELSAIEQQVIQSLEDEKLLARNLNVEYDDRLSMGQKLADKMASFGGSWTFIGIFTTVMVAWITFNSIQLLHKPFDPFPFILLNLVLSCLAAIQAPVIMMSQNRQSAKDRMGSEHDYLVNLKAELEIRHMNEKIDHLITHQWQRLLDVQEIQLELLGRTGTGPRKE